jgi:predicted PurR-regulated permease PerM
MHDGKTRTDPSDRATQRIAETPPGPDFVRRTLVVVGIVAAVAVLLLLVWYAADVLLLIFGGVLLAVLLRGAADLLSHYTRISPGWSLALVMLALVVLLGLGGWLVAGEAAAQFDQLAETLPASLRQFEEQLRSQPWGRQLLARLRPTGQLLPGPADLLSRLTGIFSTSLGILAGFVLVLFVGVYLAVDPDLYQRGVVRLVPPARRGPARDLLYALGQTLRWWLLGRLLNMTAVGVAITVGLWLLGMPFPLALGIIAFLLDFVPYIGPLLSAVPALLLALALGPGEAVAVGLLYLGIQTVESYLLAPLVQQRAVALPPALTISAQVVLGALLGVPGIVFATPLTAVLLVLVKRLYVEGVLGDSAGGAAADRGP